jgi:hypothetical protein
LAAKNSGGEIDDDLRTVRAIWARAQNGFNSDPLTIPKHENVPFRMSLDDFDRHHLVHLSSNYKIENYSALPIEAEKLVLSALGAWINVRGVWTPPKPLSVSEWRHRGTMGRDHYVRVVYEGYLFPFGHRASVIKITERKFHPDLAGNPVYLRQRMYLVVREPEKVYMGTRT